MPKTSPRSWATSVGGLLAWLPHGKTGSARRSVDMNEPAPVGRLEAYCLRVIELYLVTFLQVIIFVHVSIWSG